MNQPITAYGAVSYTHLDVYKRQVQTRVDTVARGEHLGTQPIAVGREDGVSQRLRDEAEVARRRDVGQGQQPPSEHNRLSGDCLLYTSRCV